MSSYSAIGEYANIDYFVDQIHLKVNKIRLILD